MGNVIRYSDQLYGTWGKLEDALRSGHPALPAETYLGEDPVRTRRFVQAMHERALGIARALVGSLDLHGRRAMLDVGGGPGTYSVLLTERFPGLKSEVLELPGVAAVARDLVAAAGASDRVTLRDGDYHTADFGTGKDVVLMSGMFHRETEQACRSLIKRAADCLVSGGQLIVSDVFADEGGTHPPFAAMFGLNMMLTAPDGGVHADADVKRWMADGGLRRTAHRGAAAADAAPGRAGCQAMSWRRWMVAAMASAAAISVQPAFAQTAEPPPSVVGAVKSLGQERYQIGRIVVDKRLHRFTVPGRVHALDKPLEYLATSPGGRKAYEALLELDASGSEFNLACILIGLERDPKVGCQQAARRGQRGRPASCHVGGLVAGWPAAPGNGSRGIVQCRRQDEDRIGRMGLHRARSHRSTARRFAADFTGTLITFIKDPTGLIEAVSGVGVGLMAPCAAAARCRPKARPSS